MGGRESSGDGRLSGEGFESSEKRSKAQSTRHRSPQYRLYLSYAVSNAPALKHKVVTQLSVAPLPCLPPLSPLLGNLTPTLLFSSLGLRLALLE